MRHDWKQKRIMAFANWVSLSKSGRYDADASVPRNAHRTAASHLVIGGMRGEGRGEGGEGRGERGLQLSITQG